MSPPLAVSPSPTLVPTVFGDLASLRRLLQEGGFRAEISSTNVSLVAGQGVRMILDVNPLDPMSFDGATLEVAPLSVLDSDPAAGPAVDLVMNLFDEWSPAAGQRTRDALRGSRTAPAREDTEQDVEGGFRLRIAFVYGSDDPQEDFFRATLRRP